MLNPRTCASSELVRLSVTLVFSGSHDRFDLPDRRPLTLACFGALEIVPSLP